jgi:RNA polymerase sigma factor (TIGR02999 family)
MLDDCKYLELVDRTPAGDTAARQRLFTLLYDELHRRAERELRRHSAATLSPTTLLHEAFLNIRNRNSVGADRKQFISYVSRAMRGLVIDYMRSRKAIKRGGEHQFISLAEFSESPVEGAAGCDRLQEALSELAEMDARLAECVDLKFFCGFSFREIAKLWEVSERTVQRDWEKARVVLRRLISEMTARP